MPNTNISLSYPEIWSKYLAKNLDAESKALAYTHRSIESEIKNFGDTVNVQKFGDLAVSNYTAGTDTSVTAVSLTNAQLTLDQAKYFRFVIDRLEDAQTMQDLVPGFTKRGMVSMAQAMDDRVWSHYADAAAGNVIASTATPVTITPDNAYDYIVDMAQKLMAANVDPGEATMFIDPDFHTKLKKAQILTHATSGADEFIKTGRLGPLGGFKEIVVSNRITTVSGTKPLMAFHPEFISFAVRINPSNVETYKPEAQFGTGVKCLAFYGSKVYNSTMGAVLYKAA